MGRIGEVVTRTWQTAHKMKLQRGQLKEASQHLLLSLGARREPPPFAGLYTTIYPSHQHHTPHIKTNNTGPSRRRRPRRVGAPRGRHRQFPRAALCGQVHHQPGGRARHGPPGRVGGGARSSVCMWGKVFIRALLRVCAPVCVPASLDRSNENKKLTPPKTNGVYLFFQVGKWADLVLWSPAFFGAKPEKVLKGGFIAWSQVRRSVVPSFVRLVVDGMFTFFNAVDRLSWEW